MKPIKNSQFTYTDEYGIQKIYLIEKYFEFVCLLITDYYEKEIIENDFYKYFVNLLNTLEDYNAVNFIEHYLPTYWAISIIHNDDTDDAKAKVDDDKLIMLWKKFKTQNNIEDFIIDHNILT